MLDACKTNANGSIFLKTRRRGTTLHFSQVKHVENLLRFVDMSLKVSVFLLQVVFCYIRRRIKLDFPDYGEGFIYLILREVDFDYIQVIEIEKTKVIFFILGLANNEVKAK
jgi:hypothetical protein